ncbi:arylsulfatase [Neorhodopirellula lusitana]|uniref:arylsulfatase n=1 Tax=Neorhodopirellula lusitana TaxID=445327 RepID=UPI00385088CF
MNYVKSILLLFALAGAQLCHADDRPNVILIYADDMGIGMLGCYGQKLVKTPNIDQLATEGMKFNNYYGGVLCAPARWTLLTGMHDGRKGGWGQTQPGLLMRMEREGVTEPEYTRRFDEYINTRSVPIPDNEVFLAQVAQQAGYKTAQFGKLDVGFLTNHQRVTRFGWDHYVGYFSHSRCHGFYPPYLWRDGEKFELEGNDRIDCGRMSEKGDEPVGSGGQTYSQNVFIEEILDYIRGHANSVAQDKQTKPFFLYHPTQLPHGPVAIPELHPDYANDDRLSLAEKKYASMVRMLDDHVGLIMQELKELGMDEDTMVVFTSDNGHELYYGPKKTFPKTLPNGEPANLTDKKWRTSDCGDVFDGAGGRAGLKRAAFQGGMQCPLIARWPNKIAPGTETDHFSAHYDFLATLADLFNTPAPKGKDSISYLPTLLDQPQTQQHEYIVINNGFNRMGRTALIGRDGWKLIEIDRKKNDFQLYNVLEDNEERFNLADQYPERVASLKAILMDQLDSDRPDF